MRNRVEMIGEVTGYMTKEVLIEEINGKLLKKIALGSTAS